MPSWPVHIALAKKLNKTLKLSDDFILGNIIPDVPNGYIIANTKCKENKRFTHFNINKENTKPIISIENFLKKYQNKLNNPIILGYYTHLLTDKYFNDDFHKNHVKNKDTILRDGNINNTPFKGWELKQKDFSTFGDHLTLNGNLKNTISQTKDTKKLIKDLPFTFPDEDINLTINKINSLITNIPKKQTDYLVYTEEELINTFNNCYKHILKNIKNQKIEK